MDIPISGEMDMLDGPPKRVDTHWHVVDVLQIFIPSHELKEADMDSNKQKKILLTLSEFDAREFSVYDVQKYPEQLDSSLTDKEDLQDVEEKANNESTDKEDLQDVEEKANNESTDMEDSSSQELQNDIYCRSSEAQRYTSTECSKLCIDVASESTYIHKEVSLESRDVQGDASLENSNTQGDTSTESMDVQEGSLEDWGLHEPPDAAHSESRSTQEAQGDTSTESMEVQVDTASESGPLQEVQEGINSEVDDGGGTPYFADSLLNTKEEVDLVSIHEHSSEQLCSHEVEWADYWNNWKDTLVNLAWVQRFSNHCKPEFQRWYAEYVHNYPNILPQILEGLDDFEEEQQHTEKKDTEPGVDDEEEKKRKMDSLYEQFSAHREVVHKRQYFSTQGWVNISCCGNEVETRESWTVRRGSKEDVGHPHHEDADDVSVEGRKETLEESDRREVLQESDRKETDREEILEERDGSRIKEKLEATRTNKSKRAASPAKSGGRRKKSKKSGKSFSVASVIQFLQEVEEAKKDKEKLPLTIEEVGAVEVEPLADCGSNIVNILNRTREGKSDSQHQRMTKEDVECDTRLSEKLDTSAESQEKVHIHMEGEITVEQDEKSDDTPTDSFKIAVPSMEGLNEESQRLSHTRTEKECKSDSKNVEPDLVNEVENHKAELIVREETSLEQSEDYEAELVGSKETSVEQSENYDTESLGKELKSVKQSEDHGAELEREGTSIKQDKDDEVEFAGREAISVEQPEDYEAEVVCREKTSVEQSENCEAEIAVREETSVEHFENCKAEIVTREETSLEQSENGEAEIVDREETSVEQSENCEAEISVREETSFDHFEDCKTEIANREETSFDHFEDCKTEIANREETSVEQSENGEAEIADREETSSEQSENCEAEIANREETWVEHSENHEVELVVREETLFEQSEHHEAELSSRGEALAEQLNNYKAEIGKKETLVEQSENYEGGTFSQEEESVEQLGSHLPALIGKEETSLEQPENFEAEVDGIDEASVEQLVSQEPDLVGRKETSFEQSENSEAEAVGRKQTSTQHFENCKAELGGRKETSVTNQRKRKRQEDEEAKVHKEEVERVEVTGGLQRNSTKELQEVCDVERKSSFSQIKLTIKNVAQFVITSTLKGLFNAVFMPWQSGNEVFELPDKLSPVTSFITSLRKWKEKNRILNENKNTLEKFISKNWLCTTADKWPQALQNFSVEVQTRKKKQYDKIRWSLGIYVTEEEEEEEGRKVTISMEDAPSKENGVVYFKKEKSYKTSIKEPPADLPPALHKYWSQRHRLFYKFDEGIKLDHESWYSATPECIAVHHALRCACSIVVDAFCGAGGNAIQLAFSCSHVIAIDIDEAKIEIARHNAQVYGVADRIEFIVGDFFQLAPTLKADVVFLSPPWGGPEYLSSPVYDLAHLSGEITANRLMEAAHKISPNIALFLPKNTDVKQLLCIGSKTNKKISIEKNKIGRKFKALTAYFGDIAEYWEENW